VIDYVEETPYRLVIGDEERSQPYPDKKSDDHLAKYQGNQDGNEWRQDSQDSGKRSKCIFYNRFFRLYGDDMAACGVDFNAVDRLRNHAEMGKNGMTVLRYTQFIRESLPVGMIYINFEGDAVYDGSRECDNDLICAARECSPGMKSHHDEESQTQYPQMKMQGHPSHVHEATAKRNQEGPLRHTRFISSLDYRIAGIVSQNRPRFALLKRRCNYSIGRRIE
jgi:hypothetical protein